MLQKENKGFGRVPTGSTVEEYTASGRSKISKKVLTFGGGGSQGVSRAAMQKFSDLSGPDGNNYWGTGNMATFTPEMRNPTLQSDMFFLPKYYSPDGFPNTELNMWIDHYLRFQPLVHNLVDLHATLPISRFGLVKLADEAILNFFEEMAEDLEMETKNHYILKGFFGRGESQPYSWWDEGKNRWDGMTLIDTNYITVQGHYLLHSKDGRPSEYYILTLDEYIQNLVRTADDFTQRNLSDLLEEDFRVAIDQNLQLRLDPFSTGLVKRKLNYNDLRGTSILTNCLKPLMLEDKLRENDFATAQMNINPIRLWSYGNDTIPADDAMLGDLRDMVRNASYDPQFHVFANHLLQLKIVGAAGTVTELQPKWEYIENQILTALWGNKAFTHSEGITYNNGTTAMRVLMGRYLPIRAMLENYWYKNIFLPVSLANKFFPKTEAETTNKIISRSGKKPLFPSFDWKQKQALYDDSNTRNLLVQLQQASKLPMKVICDSLELDYQYVKTWLEKEMNTVLDNDYIAGKKQLMISAIAGTLQDKGENLVKRMISAGAAFVKLVTGSDENLSVNVPDDDGKEDLKVKPSQINDKKKSKLSLTIQDKKALEEKLGSGFTEYEKSQTKDQDRIIRQNTPYLEELIEKRKIEGRKLTKHEVVQGLGDKALKDLYDNYYPSSMVTIMSKQLVNLKTLMATERNNYISKRSGVNETFKYSINDSLRNVLSKLQEEYEKNLFLLGKLASNEMAKKLQLNNFDSFISKVEEYSPLNVEAEDIEILDNNVLGAYWESFYPKLEKNMLKSMANFIKKCEIEVIEQKGIKECYFNNAPISLEELKKKEFIIKDRLLPNTNSEIKANYSHFNALIKNCPIELEYQVFDTLQKFPLSGTVDLSDATWENDKYNKKILYLYIQSRFNKLAREDKISYAELNDLHEKYFDGEKSEEDFFHKYSYIHLLGGEIKEELKKFMLKLY